MSFAFLSSALEPACCPAVPPPRRRPGRRRQLPPVQAQDARQLLSAKQASYLLPCHFFLLQLFAACYQLAQLAAPSQSIFLLAQAAARPLCQALGCQLRRRSSASTSAAVDRCRRHRQAIFFIRPFIFFFFFLLSGPGQAPGQAPSRASSPRQASCFQARRPRPSSSSSGRRQACAVRLCRQVRPAVRSPCHLPFLLHHPDQALAQAIAIRSGQAFSPGHRPPPSGSGPRCPSWVFVRSPAHRHRQLAFHPDWTRPLRTGSVNFFWHRPSSD